MRVELKKIEGRGRRGGEFKERKGSRKFVVISDDYGESIVKWWMGEWKISSERMDSRISKSLMWGSMVDSQENGRMEKVEERYSDFKRFSEKMVRIVGVEEFIRIIKWIQG